jgi:hypothetical protein
MTTESPIDVDNFTFEEVNFGEPIKPELKEDNSTDTENFWDTPPKKRKSPKRRHPDDADMEDRVLVELVDSEMSWEYVI